MVSGSINRAPCCSWNGHTLSMRAAILPVTALMFVLLMRNWMDYDISKFAAGLAPRKALDSLDSRLLNVHTPTKGCSMEETPSFVSTDERIEVALSRNYTHNMIGWTPITTCRNVTTVERVLSIPGIVVPPTICDVTYPGSIPSVLWHGEWSLDHTGCIKYLPKPHGADERWDMGHKEDAQEAQAVGIFAIVHGAVDSASSTGKTFNLTHTMSIGEHKVTVSPYLVASFEGWLSKHATPGAAPHPSGSLEARLGLQHLWTITDRPLSTEREYAAFVYVGKSLFTIHAPYLHSFQHYMFEGFPRMEAALPFLRAHPDMPILCSDSSDKVMGLCQYGLEAAGINASRIIYPIRGARRKPVTYVADTVYVANYVFQGYAVHNHKVSHAQGVSFYGSLVPAATRFQPGGVWPPLEERNIVIYTTRPWSRTRSFRPELLEKLLATMRARLHPGLTLVEVPSSRWKQDLEVFRHARAMIGPHGGMMANGIFMAPGSHIIEFGLPPGPLSRLCYFRQARAMAQEYYTVHAETWSYTEPAYNNTVLVEDVMDRMKMAGLLAP